MRNGLLFAAICSFACSTGYGSRGMMFGYSDTQIGENTFRVSCEGNGLTSLTKVSDFALLLRRPMIRGRAASQDG
jgi:hypothetical protein